MTQEEKDLLLRDICARLPYGLKVHYKTAGWEDKYCVISPQVIDNMLHRSDVIVKPYLRPMSSMTEEEKEELLNHVLGGEGVEYFHIAHDGSIDGNQEAEQDLYNLNLHWLNFGPLTASSYIDWLNKKMFDYHGLIPIGLAIEVTEDNNPYKD